MIPSTLNFTGPRQIRYLIVVDLKIDLWSSCIPAIRSQWNKALTLFNAMSNVHFYRTFNWSYSFLIAVSKWLRNTQCRLNRLPVHISQLQRQSEIVRDRLRLPLSTCATSKPVPRFVF